MSPAYSPVIGGIEQFVGWLSVDLQARGHNLQVLCLNRSAPLPARAILNGVAICRVPFFQGIMQRSPALLLQAQKQIGEIVEEFKPDVVHLHAGGPVVHAYISCSIFKSIPLVLTVHDLPEDVKLSPTFRHVLQRANQITTNSRIRLADVLKFESTVKERAQCLHVSKPPEPVHSTVPERSLHPMVFMAGRQVPEKGFDMAVAAFAQIHSRLSDACLVLAGDGPMHRSLRQSIEDNKLQNSIHLLGSISSEAITECYCQAWLTLVPSKHSESFGLVALEAMQNGCAVLASRVGGLPDVVEDGVTGRLVKPNSISALAEDMLKLLQNPLTIFAMGQAGRQRAEKCFNWDHCVNEHELVLQQVAEP